MLPYMAQGAGSAIEDGASLGVVLAKVKTRDDVKKSLESFESIRKPRSVMLQQGSMRQVCYPHELYEGAELILSQHRGISTICQMDQSKRNATSVPSLRSTTLVRTIHSTGLCTPTWLFVAHQLTLRRINPAQQDQVYGYDIFQAVKEGNASL